MLATDDPTRGTTSVRGLAAVRPACSASVAIPTDLLDRHYQAAARLGAGHVVKIPSDCPLIDSAVIDQVLETYFDAGCFDYASNLHPATYPDGNDVEVATFAALEAAWREARAPADREHTTPFLWRRPGRFRIGNVRCAVGDFAASHRVVLDYREDYDVISAVFDGLYDLDPHFGALDVVRFLDAHPEIAALNAHRRGDSWYTRDAGLGAGADVRQPVAVTAEDNA